MDNLNPQGQQREETCKATCAVRDDHGERCTNPVAWESDVFTDSSAHGSTWWLSVGLCETHGIAFDDHDPNPTPNGLSPRVKNKRAPSVSGAADSSADSRPNKKD